MAAAQGRAKQFKRGKKSPKQVTSEYDVATKNTDAGHKTKFSRISHKPLKQIKK